MIVVVVVVVTKRPVVKMLWRIAWYAPRTGTLNMREQGESSLEMELRFLSTAEDRKKRCDDNEGVVGMLTRRRHPNCSDVWDAWDFRP